MNARAVIATILLIASAALLLTRLGHYPLWDDEAITALAHVYLHRRGRWWEPVVIAPTSIALLASNYLNFLALYVCLAIDYLLIGRRGRRIEAREWLVVLLPQLIVGAIIALIWNPFATG